jgi:hypothetical protein
LYGAGTANNYLGGNTTIKGSGATSATSALIIQDSAGTAMLTLRNDGLLRLQKSYLNLSSSQEYVGISASNDGFNILSTGLGLMYLSEARTSAGVNHCFYGANVTNISGIVNHIQTSGGGGGAGAIKFAPTSGTGQFNTITLAVTIDQTGGANGVTRGLVVQPTLTNAFDWRSIEFTNSGGWGIYGSGSANNYLAGKLVIGTTTVSTFALDVNGTARVSGNLTVDTNTLFVDAANDRVGIGTTSPAYKLHVAESGISFGSADKSLLKLISGTTTEVNFIQRNVSGFVGTIISSGDALAFATNNTTKATLDSSGNLGIGTTSPSASAILDVTSTTKGFLPPRMTNAQRTAISSPAVGLIVYCTDMVEGLYVYKSTGWTFVI